MKKRISTKSIILFLVVLFFLCGAIYVIASKYGKTVAASKNKGILSDTLKDQIIAEIDGIPISAFQVELKRYINSNDVSLDDTAILNEIARERFILESAKTAGINISYDEIMKEIREEEEYVESEAARGNELMIQRQKEDEELLAALGMTKDEFNKEIYADMLLYNKTFIEYGKYYYTTNSGQGTTFEEYLNVEFDKADVAIVKK